MQSPQAKTFRIRGVDKDAATRLMAKNFTSVDTRLIGQYPALKTVNGVGGFAVDDVISILGTGYEARLNDAGIKNATVPQEASKAFGYQHSLVLIDAEHLHRLSAGRTFRIKSVSPPAAR
jgi:hypothetical protein